MRKDNPRMCFVSRERFDKSELFRFVVVSGIVTLDEFSSLSGRGFYLHKDKEAIEKARRRKMFNRFGSIKDEVSFFQTLTSLLPKE